VVGRRARVPRQPPVDAIAEEDEDKHWAYLDNHGRFKAQLTTPEGITFE
jgi:hypothetical protein